MKYCPRCQQQYPPDQRLCATDGELLSLPDPYHLVGRTLAEKYRIEALVGLGGMGAVYRARHLGIDRPVAIKILQPNLALENRHASALFEREAKLAGRLHHENVANIMDAGRTPDDLAYIAMEWLDGPTLQEELAARGPLSFERAAEILRQVSAALDAAHARHIIHRDLKPANVMLTELPGEGSAGREQVKVLDFGIAKVTSEAVAASVSVPMGTPHYASPEQFQPGGQIDQRSDIYSLGVMLYQMLTGVPLFNAPSPHELIRLQMTALPPPVGKLRPGTPLAVEQLVRRLLAKDPVERPQRAGEVAVLFERAISNSGTKQLETIGFDASPPTREMSCLPEQDDGTEGDKDASGVEREEKTSQGAGAAHSAPVQNPSPLPRRWGKRQMAATLAALLLGSAVILAYWRASGTRPLAVKSIAVLPFKPLTEAGGRDEYLAGLAQTLITKLSGIKQITVRPTSAVLKYGAPSQDPRAAGRELGVDAILDGHVQRAGERIRVTVELIQVRDGASQWAESFDERFTDIFRLQDSIAEQVAGALMLKLSGEEHRRLTRHETDNPEAYQLYLQARHSLRRRSQEGFKKAIDYFQQALEKDPHYALAYSGLASSYCLMGMFGFLPPRDAMPKAEAAVKTALDLDPTLGEPHSALAIVRAQYDYDVARAEGELRRAIELNPNYPEAHHYYALCLAATERFAEARAELDRARQADPTSLTVRAAAAFVDYLSRQYDRAIEQSQQTLALDPNFSPAHQHLGQAYTIKGMYEPAFAAFQKARALSGGSTFSVAWLGYAYAKAGRRAEAQRVLEELKESATRAYGVAWVYLGLGEPEQALAWLEQAYQDRSADLLYLKVDPIYDSLRSDPRFTDLLRRLGLAR